MEESVIRTTPGFIDVFTPHILMGDLNGIFQEPGKVIISRKTAQRLFDKQNSVNQRIDHDNQSWTVVAVYEDFANNSSLTNGIYTYMPEDDENEWSYLAYYLMDAPPGEEFIGKVNDNEKVIGRYHQISKEQRPLLELAPLRDLHLHYPEIGTGNSTTTWSLLAVGIVLILIAFINFVNFNIALVPSRVRSINMRKILGVNLSSLRMSIALEAVLLSLIAMVLACVYIHVFNGTMFSSFFSSSLALADNAATISVVMLALLLTALLLGLYPAYYTCSFDTAMVLKGSFVLSAKGARLRNILIMIQFAASIVLIVISSFIKVQHDYLQHHSWGIQKENIVYLPGHALKTKLNSFRDEVTASPLIIDYTTAGSLPGNVQMEWENTYQNKNISIVTWPVAPNFLQFFGVNILYGNDFDQQDASGREKIILNEEFLTQYEFDKDLVGGTVPSFDVDIVGIAENVNFQSLHTPIRPMGFVILNESSSWNNRWVLLKLSGSNTKEAISHIEKVWKNNSDAPFDIRFLDQTLDKLYQNENNLAKLISLFGAIAILVAVMGVYGLVVFNTRYRTKEIGIRKINGSTEQEIVLLLNKATLVLLGAAFIMAVPVSYYFVGKWLDNFAYRTPIHWWVFALAGLIILLVTAVTVSWQSWRAAIANPVDAIKTE